MRDLRSLLLLCLTAAPGCGDNNSTSDAAADVAPDIAADVSSDVARDAVNDVTNDATTDTAADVANDAPSDVITDAAPDAPRDASAEAASDASTDATMADASASCGGNACAASEICLRQRTLGGAFLPPDDAGMCPAGRHVEGASCVADYAYRCVTRPTCAGATCDCLGALCPSSFMCRGAEATLLTCEQRAP